MGMIQGILSSVVIVALINLVIQNKTNKLKFITGERAKWRECLKKIAVEIEKADADTIKIPLTELKVNINSYGNYKNNPILKERIDIFKDEHIWEIIFLIEDECIKNSNTDKFDEYKEKLIDYIGFLLKFEWERSKSEVNPDYYFLVSFILAAVGVVDGIINYKANHSDIKPWEMICLGLLLLLPGIISWTPFFVEKIRVFRVRNWFRKMNIFFWWLGGILLQLLLSIFFYKYSDFANLMWLYSFVFSLLCVANARKQHLDYSNKLNLYMKLDYVVIYYLKDGVRLTRLRLYLHKMGIVFSEVKLCEYIDGLEELAKARNIENKKVKGLVEGIKINKDNEYPYICEFIKHNNYIIRYKKGNDIYLSIGRDKKTWKKWFNI